MNTSERLKSIEQKTRIYLESQSRSPTIQEEGVLLDSKKKLPVETVYTSRNLENIAELQASMPLQTRVQKVI